MLRNSIRPVASLFLVAAIWLTATAAPALAVPVDAQPIYVQNDTARTIWVAARYMPPGSTNYITEGFWRVEPGQRKLVFNNGDSRFVHIHVHDDLGVIRGRGTPLYQTIQGREVQLYSEDTGDHYNPQTLRIFGR